MVPFTLFFGSGSPTKVTNQKRVPLLEYGYWVTKDMKAGGVSKAPGRCITDTMDSSWDFETAPLAVPSGLVVRVPPTRRLHERHLEKLNRFQSETAVPFWFFLFLSRTFRLPWLRVAVEALAAEAFSLMWSISPGCWRRSSTCAGMRPHPPACCCGKGSQDSESKSS